MARIRMDIKRELLLWAIEKSDKDLQEVGAKFPLDYWLNNERKPTFNQIVNLSKFLSVPFGYFVLEHPPEEDDSLLEYRTIMTEGVTEASRNLMDTIHDMKMKQDWMRNYLIDTGYEKLEFVGKLNKEDINNISNVVDDIKNELNISGKWYAKISNYNQAFNFLKDKAIDAGILVFQNGVALNNTHRPLDLKEFRAFALIDPYTPLIFLNAKDAVSGKIFSLIHEIVHIWLGKNSLYNDYSYYNENSYVRNVEVYCNAIAAEFLVPETEFLKKWEQIGKAGIGEIANEFKVSSIVIARRALDHKKISQKEYEQNVNDTLQRVHRLKQKEKGTGGGDYYKTAHSRLDRRFLNALADQTAEGKTLYTTAHRLTGLNRQTFENLLMRIEERE